MLRYYEVKKNSNKNHVTFSNYSMNNLVMEETEETQIDSINHFFNYAFVVLMFRDISNGLLIAAQNTLSRDFLML